MLALQKPLLSLTAADLMSRTVIVIPQDMSLRAAARLLSQHRVSGAPVVDARGRCAGVLSSTDFMHFMENEEHARRPHRQSWPDVYSAWQVVDPDALPVDKVSTYMTADPVTATSAINIGTLARQMLDAHIHRIVVVDEKERPVGIVSSTDILAALAQQSGEGTGVEP
jgi:CBS domain-containing membrane protein